MDRLASNTIEQLSAQNGKLCRLANLAGANAASVAALYLGQVLAKPITAAFPCDAWSLSLIPGATLLGYAIGVSAIAFSRAGSAGLSITAHTALLVLALCIAGLAPTASTLVMASLAVGTASSVAQRLLATAGSLGGITHGGAFIGRTVCAALLAVLGLRLAGDVAAQLLGWRSIFFLVAMGAVVFGVQNYRFQVAAVSHHPGSIAMTALARGWLLPLWRQSPLLRNAVFQHGAMFAAYSVAWMTILVEIPAQERAAVVIGGGGVGVTTAFLAGYYVDRFARHDLARFGAAAIAVSVVVLLPVAFCLSSGLERVLLLLPGMALLDGGLQLALVANQTRVQALLAHARPQLAALLTVCGSLGGALGAGLGYWLCQRFGWQAAICLGALSGLAGFGFATLAGSKQRNKCAAPADQHVTSYATLLHAAVPRGLHHPGFTNAPTEKAPFGMTRDFRINSDSHGT